MSFKSKNKNKKIRAFAYLRKTIAASHRVQETIDKKKKMEYFQIRSKTVNYIMYSAIKVKKQTIANGICVSYECIF